MLKNLINELKVDGRHFNPSKQEPMYKLFLYITASVFMFASCLFADGYISHGDSGIEYFSGQSSAIIENSDIAKRINMFYDPSIQTPDAMDNVMAPPEDKTKNSDEYLTEKTKLEVKLLEAKLKRYLNYGWNKEASETREKLAKAMLKLYHLRHFEHN